MTTDPDELARIAAARTFLGPYGPANLDALLGQQMGANPVAIVFMTLDRKRRISAARWKAAPWTGRDTLQVGYLDGAVTGDDQVATAIIDLMWRPSPANCEIQQLNVVNGALAL
ncbi:MAG TPA: hypothetical protein VHO06_12530 [Polyangia bacterium]|nr:hypothetical protein [Polyangia bacterium]